MRAPLRIHGRVVILHSRGRFPPGIWKDDRYIYLKNVYRKKVGNSSSLAFLFIPPKIGTKSFDNARIAQKFCGMKLLAGTFICIMGKVYIQLGN